MASVLKYTVLRLGLFALALLILMSVGAGPLVALGGAAVISLMLSYLWLRGPRDEVARQVAARVAARRPPVDADALAEDAEAADAAEAAAKVDTDPDASS